MKYYNYLLYRLYVVLSKDKHYSSSNVLFLTTLISSFYIYISFYTFWKIINFYLFPSVDERNLNVGFIPLILLFVICVNYYFFIKGRKFLKYDFKEDRLGGYLIFGYIIIVFILFILIANKFRDRIGSENDSVKIESDR